jgi:hypothetical protein
MMRISTAALAFAASALLAAPLTAQMPHTPRALGTGGAYLGMARGHSAVFLNPANLDLPGSPYWSIAFPQFSIGATASGASVWDVNEYRQTSKLPEARRAELLAAIPAEGTEVAIDVRMPVFAMQFGRVGVGVAYNMIGEHTFGKDIFDLVLNQYQEGRTDYSIGNTAGRRATYLDFAGAYGRRVGPLTLGVTGHYYHGLNLVHSRVFEPRFDLQAADIEVDMVSVLARGGSGYGVDVGAAFQPIPSVTVSAAVANVASKMTWSENLRYRELTVRRVDFGASDPTYLLQRYEDSEQDLLDAGTPQIRRTAEGLYDQAFFPATLRAGVAVDLPTRTHVGVAYMSNLTEGRLAGRWERLASVGVQQKLPVGTLRAGLSSNFDAGSILSGGLSLGVLEMGIARVSDGDYFGGAREGVIATFGINVQTTTLRR